MHVKGYYDQRIKSVVRYRIDPASVGPMRSQGDGWKSAYNSITGLRLRVSDEAIEVRGFGPFRRLVETFGRAKLSLPPQETAMWTGPSGTDLQRRAPWPEADYVALTCTLPNDAEYTLAVRPSDRDLDRLRDALRMAGVRAS